MNVFISNSQIIKIKKYYEISTINMNAAKKMMARSWVLISE